MKVHDVGNGLLISEILIDLSLKPRAGRVTQEEMRELALLADSVRKERDELLEKSLIFFDEVIPQIGKICLQDYENLNELGTLLSKRRTG